MRPWHLGNTTVRSPFRLRDGLVALSSSPLEGNLHGPEQEIAFRLLLGTHGIVTLGEDETNSVGRKWRSALSKLGFLYPKVPSKGSLQQKDVGPSDGITPNGRRLILAGTVPAMQECFLRSLAAFYISSFSPLRHVLAIMLALQARLGESTLHFMDMAVVVQLTGNDDSIDTIIARILNLRERREAATNKRSFDGRELEATAAAVSTADKAYVSTTFKDYADTNFRYLKATGLVQSKGRGISLVPEKLLFIRQLVEDKTAPSSGPAYYVTLCKGAALPTDDKDSAAVVLDDLLKQVRALGIPFEMAGRPVDSAANIAVVRHAIENLLAERNEEDYAARQAAAWQEIAAYMEIIGGRGKQKILPDGKEIRVPQAEAPAYFEWALWRAFLAIGSLVNKPYDARRFKIDQDFLPIGTAPGNGPDLVFEFSDFALVVEVTLTGNSRQEAVEGEPVRRHVAEQVAHFEALKKPVYGLFIANRIDSNTAETFRTGGWYGKNDQKMKLDIIPVTLAHFKDLFEAMFRSDRHEAASLRILLAQCSQLRNTHDAPAWKLEIEKAFARYSTALSA